jgi:hypothetical protein
VDKILIIYNEEFTDFKIMLSEFNTLSPKQKFTYEIEENSKMNVPDVTIMKTRNSNHRNPQEAH